MKQHIQTREEKLSTFVFGKVPPQAIPLEEAVLGACLIDKEAYPVLLGIGVNENTFYLDRHKRIYLAMQSLYRKIMSIDLLTVTEELKRLNFLDDDLSPYELVELSNKIASSANIEYHSRILRQKEMRRAALQFSYDLSQKAHDDTQDEFDVLEYAQKAVSEISSVVSSKQEKTGEQIGNGARKQINEQRNGGIFAGLKCGIANLDRKTGGFKPGQLITLAARPGMGKSSFVTTIIRNMAAEGIKCGLFSFEMTSEEQFFRMVAQEAQLNLSKLVNASTMDNAEYSRFLAASEIIESFSVVYYDGSPDFAVVTSKIRSMAAQGCQIILIDYLQLMKNGGKFREQEISDMTRDLKGLAKELKVPIIQVSQLSRQVEMRGGSKRPQLSDLRESGAIEQDSDLVTFIYRPEYYQIFEDENGNSTKGLAEIIIAKFRNGEPGTVLTRFVKERTEFQYDATLDDEKEETQIEIPLNW
ncbi:MAG TPA: replicative DNA helicase [Haliscomenobacter sp.]|uniref:replicative DNA helicase n=1 Tax=Haliscomenobacter sp. TaxID=2717303 RepID=UPI002B753EEF|nr:replicative DNA helicase [Haliscomenobacter sp.]HOY18144.1 replicative DNA helicase [Haliscomenobacter sp.]